MTSDEKEGRKSGERVVSVVVVLLLLIVVVVVVAFPTPSGCDCFDDDDGETTTTTTTTVGCRWSVAIARYFHLLKLDDDAADITIVLLAFAVAVARPQLASILG